MPTSAAPPTERRELTKAPASSRRGLSVRARIARRGLSLRAVCSIASACAVLGGSLVLGCAGAATRTALQGDLAQLKAEVSRADRQGELSRSAVQELAAAVLQRELSSVRRPLADFPDLAPCARDLSSVLRELAEGSDEPAAFAALALLDAGLDAPGPSADESSGPAASIVEARRAVGAGAGARRRALMLHGDADVRRAALQAAAHSDDAADARPLLEVARLDPDVHNRRVALRALGALGGSEVVVGLADLWAVAETEQRLHIIEAWATPASLASGGRTQLLRAAELESGIVAVSAALALARSDAEAAGLATTLLGGALRGSDVSARLLALYEVPWSNRELQSLVVQAQSSPEASARWVSLFRQVEQGSAPEPARQALRELASEGGATVGLLARVTLARAGDATVKPALREDLKAARGRDRMLAALALAELGEWGGAAQGLADDSPSVRQTVACQLLSEPRPDSPPEQARSELFGPLAPALTRQLLSGQVSSEAGRERAGPSGS